jgi:uncharacterized protein YpmB
VDINNQYIIIIIIIIIIITILSLIYRHFNNQQSRLIKAERVCLAESGGRKTISGGDNDKDHDKR